MDSATTFQETPLYRSHVTLGAKMAPFGGWMMPIQYQGILAEHAHTRQGVSVFDICHMGEFMIEGDAVSSGLDRIVTQKISSMPQGTCRYGFMLNEQGGVIDDLVVYRLDQDRWMLVVNAATIAGDEANLKKHLSKECVFENVSPRTGKLDIQGPGSLEALSGIFGGRLKELTYYTFADFTFEGGSCIISRTGYTGELGYEIYVSAGRVVELWERLLSDARIKPAGLGCRDTLRLEMGYPLYGHELDVDHTPLAAGLGKFVDLSKDFIGKEALLREEKSGPKERLVCFRSDSRRSARNGYAIFDLKGSRIGTTSSGSFSPSLSVSIGMGYIAGKHQPGEKLVIKDAAAEIPVTIVKKPFYSKA